MNNFQKLNFDNTAVKKKLSCSLYYSSEGADAKVRQFFTFKNILFINEIQEPCDEPQQAKFFIKRIYQDTKFVFNFISIDYIILSGYKLECLSVQNKMLLVL